MMFKIYGRDVNNAIFLKDVFSDTDSFLVFVGEEKDKTSMTYTDGNQLDMAVYNSNIFSEEEMLGVMNG